MSLSTRSYSKESRSSSYYSRSASYHSNASTNQNQLTNSLSRSRTLTDSRPLSTRLIERDSPLSWHWDFDDPFYFDRLRWRLDNGIWRWNWWPLEWSVPLTYRTWESSSTRTRTIPVQYSSSSTSINRRPKAITNSSSSSSIRHDESSMSNISKFFLFYFEEENKVMFSMFFFTSRS